MEEQQYNMYVKGKFTLSDGRMYLGEYIDDKKNGKGMYITSQG